MAVVTIPHGATTLRVDVDDDVAAAIRASLERERETLDPRAWRRLVLACSQCRRPCLGDVPCDCCSRGASLCTHPVLMTADDFLARAKRLAGRLA